MAGFNLEKLSVACVRKGKLHGINIVAVAILGQCKTDLGLGLG